MSIIEVLQNSIEAKLEADAALNQAHKEREAAKREEETAAKREALTRALNVLRLPRIVSDNAQAVFDDYDTPITITLTSGKHQIADKIYAPGCAFAREGGNDFELTVAIEVPEPETIGDDTFNWRGASFGNAFASVIRVRGQHPLTQKQLTDVHTSLAFLIQKMEDSLQKRRGEYLDWKAEVRRQNQLELDREEAAQVTDGELAQYPEIERELRRSQLRAEKLAAFDRRQIETASEFSRFEATETAHDHLKAILPKLGISQQPAMNNIILGEVHIGVQIKETLNHDGGYDYRPVADVYRHSGYLHVTLHGATHHYEDSLEIAGSPDADVWETARVEFADWLDAIRAETVKRRAAAEQPEQPAQPDPVGQNEADDDDTTDQLLKRLLARILIQMQDEGMLEKWGYYPDAY